MDFIKNAEGTTATAHLTSSALAHTLVAALAEEGVTAEVVSGGTGNSPLPDVIVKGAEQIALLAKVHDVVLKEPKPVVAHSAPDIAPEFEAAKPQGPKGEFLFHG